MIIIINLFGVVDIHTKNFTSDGGDELKLEQSSIIWLVCLVLLPRALCGDTTTLTFYEVNGDMPTCRGFIE